MLANMTVFKLELPNSRVVEMELDASDRRISTNNFECRELYSSKCCEPSPEQCPSSYSLFISNLSMYTCWIASSFCRMPSKAITSPTPLLFHHPDPVEQHQHRFILDLEQHCCCCHSVFKVIRLSPVQVDCMWSWMPQTDVEI
eukprot:scaffold18261_cov141-Skeletonema_marinoi.AAC.2